MRLRRMSAMQFSRVIIFLLLVKLGFSVDVEMENNDTTAVLIESTCNQAECLRCDLETAQCQKCLYVIIEKTRQCLTYCPLGHYTAWIQSNQFSGQVCFEGSMLAMVSGRDIIIIAGAALGGAVCVGVVIGALLYTKKRAKPSPDVPLKPVPRMWRDKRPNAAEVVLEGDEKKEFLNQLSALRDDSGNFLEMLNETRSKFRGLTGHDSATDTKGKAYRAVVRDLSRMLALLSRREDSIHTVPADWKRLLPWASRILSRYKRQKAAKVAGEISAMDHFPITEGTIYQTRRQAAAERRRISVEKSWSKSNAAHLPNLNEACEDNSCFTLYPYNEEQKALHQPIYKENLDNLEERELYILGKEIIDKNANRIKYSEKLNSSLGKAFWNKIMNSRNEDDEVASYFGIVEDNNLINSAKSEDHIPSPTFFDHIESFSFPESHVSTDSPKSKSSSRSSASSKASPSYNNRSRKLKLQNNYHDFINNLSSVDDNKFYKRKPIPKFETDSPAVKCAAEPVNTKIENNYINTKLGGSDVYVNVIRKPATHLSNKDEASCSRSDNVKFPYVKCEITTEL